MACREQQQQAPGVLGNDGLLNSNSIDHGSMNADQLAHGQPKVFLDVAVLHDDPQPVRKFVLLEETGMVEEPSVAERACMDDNSTNGSIQFCRLYEVSERSRSLLIPPTQLESKKSSPTKPFFNTPCLGVESILKTLFRARGTSTSTKGVKAFTCWVACPSSSNNEALSFTTGHSFCENDVNLTYANHGNLDFGQHNFSELRGCFGKAVNRSEFDTFSFKCSSKPLAIVKSDDEDLALFVATDVAVDCVLLPCSAGVEMAENKKFMAAFSYPCTQTSITEAYEELIEGKADHGIKKLYALLNLEDDALYQKLFEVFRAFHDGTLLCSPGALGMFDDVKCYYKCTTGKGSSGGPIIPTHLPGYVVGIHKGGVVDKDYNQATSTDSPAFVKVYSEFVLPRLPPRESIFWTGWDLQPFLRWLQKHHLTWGEPIKEYNLMERITKLMQGWSSWSLLNGGKIEEEVNMTVETTPPPTLKGPIHY
ncbi:hypothetical protein GOP47_0020006 [Adiantum capillus-veneris]|uniref:Uncharacterized protein n=2 Tax=Adiantum capillus-veneris TaxID=13818 RepID=A0A9D4UDR2_ADICA|nr:hypothetical protein GOP47_0020006 [Adiantum capillus-veneris]